MRLVGLAYVGALVVLVAVAAFRLQAGTEDPSAVAPPDPSAPALVAGLLPTPAKGPIRADEQGGTEPAEAAESQERMRETVPPPAPRRRSFRRRSRNRYPGPIPTPADWKPPEGPVRIALQAGHWRANEAPRELRGLRNNGTSWRGTAEWEVNLEIVRRAGTMLEGMGYEVDILPAVVLRVTGPISSFQFMQTGVTTPTPPGIASRRRGETPPAGRRKSRRCWSEATGRRRALNACRRPLAACGTTTRSTSAGTSTPSIP